MKKIIKAIYSLIPFKKSLFSILKLVSTPSQNLYKHLYFKGVFKVKLKNNKSFKIMHYGFELENEIFWMGLENGWEKVSTSIWIELCKTSKTIVDVGANTGIYSLIAKTVNKDAQVFAFEPVARVFSKLESNNKLNEFDIKSYELALSNYNGDATIYDANTEHTYSVAVNKNLKQSWENTIETKIKTITLSSFIEQNNIANIDLIKIDVETHEPEVLEGFGNYLAKYKPAMLIEILNDEVAEKIQNQLKDIHYLFFNIDENNGVRKVEKLTKSDYYNFLICSEEIAAKLKLI